MVIYKVTVTKTESEPYTAVVSSYRNPVRVTNEQYYATKELAEKRVADLKAAADVLCDINYNVSLREITVIDE